LRWFAEQPQRDRLHQRVEVNSLREIHDWGRPISASRSTTAPTKLAAVPSGARRSAWPISGGGARGCNRNEIRRLQGLGEPKCDLAAQRPEGRPSRVFKLA